MKSDYTLKLRNIELGSLYFSEGDLYIANGTGAIKIRDPQDEMLFALGKVIKISDPNLLNYVELKFPILKVKIVSDSITFWQNRSRVVINNLSYPQMRGLGSWLIHYSKVSNDARS